MPVKDGEEGPDMPPACAEIAIPPRGDMALCWKESIVATFHS